MWEGMTNEQFREWRERMHWSQAAAAQELGVSKRTVQLYEAGTRDGRAVEIPRAVEIACFALERGLRGYGAATDAREG